MRWTVLLACAATLAGCSRDSTPTIDACAGILASRVPGARIVAAVGESDADATIDFEVGSRWGDAVRGRLVCAFEAQPGGALRLRAAALDGAALTSADLTVINADLLLAEMRRAGARAAERDE